MPALAAAQPKRDPAAADEAFRAAVAAKLKGDWVTACAKFDASMQLDPAPSTLLNVAECLEHDGKLARAWSETQRARVLNAETPGEQRRKDLDAYATTAMTRLRGKLAWVQIVTQGAPAGLTIEKDGVQYPAAVLDQPIPADPGSTKVKASAPGYRTVEIDLTLSEGKTTEVPVALVPAPKEAPTATATAIATTTASAPPVTAPARPIWPWIVGGVGLAFAGAAVGFGVSEAATQAEIDKSCNNTLTGRCPLGYPYQEKNDALWRDFGLAIGFGIAGALGLGAGALGLAVAPRVTPTHAGITATGAF
ncbi:MAG: hypothetical protein U0441_12485 [Polyangiaceae bacterium]